MFAPFSLFCFVTDIKSLFFILLATISFFMGGFIMLHQVIKFGNIFDKQDMFHHEMWLILFTFIGIFLIIVWLTQNIII